MGLKEELDRAKEERRLIVSGELYPRAPLWLSVIGEADWTAEIYFIEEEIRNRDMEQTRTQKDLNDYARECFEANFNWWLDLNATCGVCGGLAVTLVTLTVDPEMACSECRGTGFARKTRNLGEQLALCVSELSEALEGHRKQLPDDKLPHRRMAEVELVDFLIRAFDMAGGRGYNLAPLVKRMEYMNGETGQMVYPPPFNPQVGATLNEISATCYVHLPENFAEALMIITGKLVDTNRYRDYADEQAREMYQAVYLALALGSREGFDLEGAYREKMEYNRSRIDHSIEGRKAAHGKAY